ncbi:TylF/MycF/NovP-related O-methyltransferase [Aeromicrobium sp. CF4.19]|uniref:TylF/MycF/NovP-related O-methyltransferase n=1 Tax=Aeromicrobium sp. CF4.19 TaxID=3373082 RepID=UPI003EE6E808
MHLSAMASMKRCIDTYLIDDVEYQVLDFGSFINTGQKLSHRQLLGHVRAVVTGVDIQAGRNVDRQMIEPYTIPVDDDSMDVVITGQVFEHIPFPFVSMIEIARVLRPGGLLFFAAPSRGHRHSTYDLWRYYPDSLRAFASFAELELLEAHTAWPPTQDQRFLYGQIDADEYWGDTVGVMRKPTWRPSRARKRRHRVLRDWANELGGLERVPIPGPGPTPDERRGDRGAVRELLESPELLPPDAGSSRNESLAPPTKEARMSLVSVAYRIAPQPVRRIARRLKRGRNFDELRAARDELETAKRKLAPAKKKPAGPKYPDDLDQRSTEIMTAIKPYTMTSIDKQHALITSVRHIVDADIDGAIVECGVWRGGSMHAVIHVLKDLGALDRELYLFDTFEGMTEPTEKDLRATDGRSASELLEKYDRTSWVWAVASLEDVTEGLGTLGYPDERVHLVKGPVEETIPAGAPERIALLRLDTDWYESTKHELEHLYDRLAPGGVLIIDDYGSWAGSKEATDDFLAALPVKPLMLRAGRARVGVKPA